MGLDLPRCLPGAGGNQESETESRPEPTWKSKAKKKMYQAFELRGKGRQPVRQGWGLERLG